MSPEENLVLNIIGACVVITMLVIVRHLGL